MRKVIAAARWLKYHGAQVFAPWLISETEYTSQSTGWRGWIDVGGRCTAFRSRDGTLRFNW